MKFGISASSILIVLLTFSTGTAGTRVLGILGLTAEDLMRLGIFPALSAPLAEVCNKDESPIVMITGRIVDRVDHNAMHIWGKAIPVDGIVRYGVHYSNVHIILISPYSASLEIGPTEVNTGKVRLLSVGGGYLVNNPITVWYYAPEKVWYERCNAKKQAYTKGVLGVLRNKYASSVNIWKSGEDESACLHELLVAVKRKTSHIRLPSMASPEITTLEEFGPICKKALIAQLPNETRVYQLSEVDSENGLIVRVSDGPSEGLTGYVHFLNFVPQNRKSQ